MSIEDCKQIILDNFRDIKLEKDYAQLQLSLFQVEELISHYEKLIDLQKEIQSKHYLAIKHMEDIDLLDDYDYVNWHQNRESEISSWQHELAILTEYKHHINKIIQDIEDGTAAKKLAEREKEFIK
ncbi:hypothetical protein [Methanobrevibacter sp.]